MTYFRRPIAPFKVDFIRIDVGPNPLTNDPILPLSGSPTHTNATRSGNEITVYSGSHWRIELSQVAIRAANVDLGAYAEIYSVTDSAITGTRGVLGALPGTPPSNTQYLTQGRATACALILNSDITTSKTLRFQLDALASNLFLETRTDRSYQNYGIVKILELPA